MALKASVDSSNWTIAQPFDFPSRSTGISTSTILPVGVCMCVGGGGCKCGVPCVCTYVHVCERVGCVCEGVRCVYVRKWNVCM